MEDKQIDQLINQALRIQQRVPADLALRIEQQLDAAYLAEKSKKRVYYRRLATFVSSVAAVLLVSFVLFRPMRPASVHTVVWEDTYDNPQDAELAVYEAQVLLRGHWQKGMYEVDKSHAAISKSEVLIKKIVRRQ